MSSSNKKLVLKKLKEHNTIWHPESTVVFKSQNERLVIGRYVDGNLIPLDEIALERCEEWNFKPDESLLEADVSEEGNEEGDGGVDNGDCDGGDGDCDGDGGVDNGDGGDGDGENFQGKSSDITSNNNFMYEPICNDVSNNLKELTIKCFSNIETSFAQVLESNYEKTIKNMSEYYVKKIQELNIELKNTKEKLIHTKADYDIIKKKFDAMKSLFN